jgi:cytoskeletal protein CcmA (bactofilin family)
MWNRLLPFLLWLVACGVNAQAEPPSAQRSGPDQFMAGGNLRIGEAVTGDLIAAAGTLDLDAAVAGDALLLGGNIRIGAGVGRSLYAAGGRVTLHGPVGHNLRVAGGQVELLREANVAGNVSVAGGQVTLRGTVQGDVRVGGGTVLIDGPVQGSVWVSAGQLRLGPNARLAGVLHWRSNKDLERDPAAQISGELDRMPWPAGSRNAKRQDDDAMSMRDGHHGMDGYGYRGWRSHSMITGGWWWNLGLMLLAAAAVAAMPQTMQGVSTTLRTRWPASLLAGLVVIACVPVAALLLLITIIGAPLALVLLLLYPPLLIVGYVSFGAAAGQWALSGWRSERATQTSWRVAAAMLAVLLLALLASVPVLGWLVAWVAVLSGVGVIALQWRHHSANPVAAVPS